MAYWPRMIESFTGTQPLRLACWQDGCGKSWLLLDEDGNVDLAATMEVMNNCGTCPRCGSHNVGEAYFEAVRCVCGKLGMWEEVLDYCCSRRCQLAKEWLDFLRHRLLYALYPEPWQGYA